MSYVDTLSNFRWDRLWLVILGLIPYLDLEVLGVIPIIRDLVPEVDPIYVLDLSWMERLRLLVLIAIPYVDGEWIKLFFDTDVNEVIAD